MRSNGWQSKFEGFILTRSFKLTPPAPSSLHGKQTAFLCPHHGRHHHGKKKRSKQISPQPPPWLVASSKISPASSDQTRALSQRAVILTPAVSSRNRQRAQVAFSWRQRSCRRPSPPGTRRAHQTDQRQGGLLLSFHAPPTMALLPEQDERASHGCSCVLSDDDNGTLRCSLIQFVCGSSAAWLLSDFHPVLGSSFHHWVHACDSEYLNHWAVRLLMGKWIDQFN